MPGLDDIPVQFQPIAGVVFAIVVAVGSGLVFLRGKREGAPREKIHEFNMTGQLQDMGPVKELVGQTGLLVQQQLRTAVALEAVAAAINRLADAYLGQLKEERDEQEVETEVERRVDKQLREQRRRQSRPRKPTAPKP
jgi:hypothetical protein